MGDLLAFDDDFAGDTGSECGWRASGRSSGLDVEACFLDDDEEGFLLPPKNFIWGAGLPRLSRNKVMPDTCEKGGD